MLKDFTLYFLTWNVAGQTPTENLEASLGLGPETNLKSGIENVEKPLPDIYAITFQEVSVKPQKLLYDFLFDDPWIESVKKLLCKHNYVKVKHTRLQGIVLLIFSKREHLSSIRNVQSTYTKTGFGGAWGNKGAVSIRFSAYGCSICFTGCHLAAHDEFYAQRILEYNTVIDTQNFVDPLTKTILTHDYVFWFGDLNFRIDKLTAEVILKLIADRDYGKLMENDQLAKAQRTGEAFAEFTESMIKFPPTYKYYFGSGNSRKNVAVVTDGNNSQELLEKSSSSFSLKDNSSTSKVVPVNLKSKGANSESSSSNYHKEDTSNCPESSPIKAAPVTFSNPYSKVTESYNYLSRKPAWTDRILYRYTPNAYETLKVSLSLEQIDYKSHDHYVSSDHKPVSSSFRVKVFSEPDLVTVYFYAVVGWNVANSDLEAWFQFNEGHFPSVWDWIGLYKADFTSVDEHLHYVWATTVPARGIPWVERELQVLNHGSVAGASTSNAANERVSCPQESKEQVVVEAGRNSRPWYKVVFMDQSLLVPGQYRLLYINGRFNNVLGMSAPFNIT